MTADHDEVFRPSVAPAPRFPGTRNRTPSQAPEDADQRRELRQLAAEARRLHSLNRLDEGLKLLEWFAEDHPGSVECFLEAGNLCLEADRPQQAVWLLQEACDRAPRRPELHQRLGEALLAAGEPREALEALRRAIKLGENRPELAEAFDDTDTPLGHDVRIEALERACRRFEERLRLHPEDSEDLNQWGVTLHQLADLTRGGCRKRLLEQACQRFQEALRHQPEMYRAHYNRGNALDNLAELVADDERLRLRQQACRCFEQALAHNPGYANALDNWSGVLLKMGAQACGERRMALWCEAAQRASEANQLEPHAGDFNLACAWSRMQRFEEAARLVATQLLRRPEMRQHALGDPDLLPLWNVRPELREAIRESVASGQNLAPMESWLSAS